MPPLFAEQWECPCGTKNGFLRTKCRHCQRSKGNPMLEPKVKICDMCKRSGHSRAEHEEWNTSQAAHTLPCPGSEPRPAKVIEADIKYGLELTESFFQRRGAHNIEVKLDRETLGMLLTLAHSEGREKARG